MARWESLIDKLDRRWNLENGHAEDCPQHRWDKWNGHEPHSANECPCCRDGVMLPEDDQ